MFQILVIVVLLALAIFFIMRLVPSKLWRPFYRTMGVLERFRIEEGRSPQFEATEVKEFAELNATLSRLMEQSVRSYQVQKQFTENASHEVLLESMLKNLVVNAVRHNHPGGDILLTLCDGRLVVSNTSDEPPLDTHHLFERFRQSTPSRKGNGLGLAIVKSICDYHGWRITYAHRSGRHEFCVDFGSSTRCLNKNFHRK